MGYAAGLLRTAFLMALVAALAAGTAAAADPGSGRFLSASDEPSPGAPADSGTAALADSSAVQVPPDSSVVRPAPVDTIPAAAPDTSAVPRPPAIPARRFPEQGPQQEPPPDQDLSRPGPAAPPGGEPGSGVPGTTGSRGPASAGEPGEVGEAHRRLPLTAVGAYAGYPSYGGVQFSAPVDGILAFRSGLTGFPHLGILWTPGIEVRFGQEPGTYNHSGGYGFANMRVGRSTTGDKHQYFGLESGLGFRWILWDRRGFRWIAACEAGGSWSPASMWPQTASGRIFWMMARS
jgi:hypothetical protein